MRNDNLVLLGISEARWTQAGQTRLMSGEMLLYSGHEEENAPHTEDVALLLSQSAQRALNVIQWYAPTNNHKEETKDDFYNRLQNILGNSEKDMTLLVGDLTAKIGEDNIGYEEVMGRLVPYYPYS